MAVVPLFTNIADDEYVLVAGGGRVAKQKLSVLTSLGVAVDIVATEFDDEIDKMAKELGIPSCVSEKNAGDVSSERKITNKGINLIREDCLSFKFPVDRVYRLAVAATDDREVNRTFAKRCRERHIPVNVVDDPDECDFIFPSVVKRGDLVCAVSSGGKCPPATQYFRDRIGKMLPDDVEEIMKEMESLREKLKEDVINHKERADILYEEIEKRVDYRNKIS